MKRSTKKRSLSCFLAGVMVLGLAMPQNAVAQTASGTLANPFASMYDSDNLFLEEVGLVLEKELTNTYQSTDEPDDKMDMPLPLDMVRFNVGELSQQKPQQEQHFIDSQNLLSEEDLSYLSGQVLAAVKEDNLGDFPELELEEQSRDEIEKLYEDSRVDSYIVKYKDPEGRERLMSQIQIADVVEAVAVELPSDFVVDLKKPTADEVQTVHSTEELEDESLKSSSDEDLTKEENESSVAVDVTKNVSESSVADADIPEGEVTVPTGETSEEEDVPLVTDDSNNQSVNQEESTYTGHEKDVDTGLLERIVLSEKVNPAEFAAQLQAAGLAQDIEYIQPDFLFSYASLGLVVKEVAENEDGTGKGKPGSDTAEAGEDTATEAITENKDDTTSNSEESKVDDTKELENQPNEEKLSEAERLEQERLEAERLEQERLEEERLKQLEKQPQVLQDVIVALIDTGVDVNHPALEKNLLPGWNFVANSDDVYNEDYPMQAAHGTHIAGIIAQNSQSEHVKIMPLQVFGEHGAYTSDIIAAIHYAEQNGASVVNMSFGSGSYNFALEETMSQSGMLFVSAAGNARSDLVQAPVYPAAFTLDNMISVASLNTDKGFSYYSNYNPTLVDIAALGRDVESALPEGEYGLQSGTSMSAGYVSAAAGSVLTETPDLQAGELKQRLLVTADMYEHLENKVAEGRSLNQANAVANNIQTDTTSCSYEEDFDVYGYQPTPSESWELFSSKTVVDLAAGQYHSLALCSDGTVWSWGRNNYGQLGNGNTKDSITPIQVIGLNNVIAVAAGVNHSLALKSDGTVWAWGYNFHGQLGDGSTTRRITPVQVSGLSNVSGISTGFAYSVAVKKDGTVWAWGLNSSGQLGDSSTKNRNMPVQVIGLSNVCSIATGDSHSLALKEDGTVWAWGDNYNGQLGDGSKTNRPTPVQVSGLSNVYAVAVGNAHSFALKEDGTVWAWGYNGSAQFGDGSWTSRSTPVQVSGLNNVSSIVAGDFHSMVVKEDGTIWAWGSNSRGQLGDGSTTTRPTPVQVSGLSDVTILVAGGYHSLALTSDGTLWVWGFNDYGQLGNGILLQRGAPIQVMGLSNITAIAGGYGHSLALKEDGTVWAWGWNVAGQFGDGSIKDSSMPVQVSGLSNVCAIAAGNQHSLALKEDGTVWAWGSNNSGQLGGSDNTSTLVQVDGLSNVCAIAAGGEHSLALKEDGTVWAWGENLHGQLGIGTRDDSIFAPVEVHQLSNVTAISAGTLHSLAIVAVSNIDNVAMAWGFNDFGQLGNGLGDEFVPQLPSEETPVQVSELSNVSAIAGGFNHSLYLEEDGTVWACGWNMCGQLGFAYGYVPTGTLVQVSGLSNVSDIAGGYGHSLFLKEDGKVWACGSNQYGQLGDGSGQEHWVPVSVNGLSDVSAIDAGMYHSLALKEDGTVWAWGYNYYGQLGNGEMAYYTTPVQALLGQRIPASIAFNSERYTSTIPEAGDEDKKVTISATVLDEDGDPMGSTPIVYALGSVYEGVTIDGSTGVVTITSQAIAGTVVVTATSGTLTANINLVLTERIPTSIAFTSESYTSPIPAASAKDKKVTVSATVLDEDGEPMGSEPIIYALDEEYEGVTIDGNTGVVTITSQAVAGTVVVTATSGTFTANVNLVLGGTTPARNQANISATAGKYYDITVIAGRVEDFSGMEITLAYDADVFELADLCSFTKQKELTVGPLSEMGVTVTNLSAGEVRFKVDKSIPDGREWSGVLDVLRLKAKTSGEGDVSITQ